MKLSRHSLFFVGGVLLMLVQAWPAQAGGEAKSARKAIETVYQQQTMALNHRNVEGFLSLCTPDYQDIAHNKQVFTAARMRRLMPGQLHGFPALKFTTTLQSFTLHGNKATVTAVRHLEATRHDSEHHRTVPWVSDTTTEDVWVKTPQGWRTKRSKEIAFVKRTPKPIKSNALPGPNKPKPAKRRS